MSTNKIFQPADGTWQEYAQKGDLRSVLDPNDCENKKNKHVDLIHKTAVDKAIGSIAQSTILDFGCGTGRICRYLSNRENLVLGLECTEAMLVNARKLTHEKNIKYILFNGKSLPIADHCIDMIISIYVLQYCVKNTLIFQNLIEEFYRILTPKGKLLLIEQISYGSSSSTSVNTVIKKEDYLNFGEKYRPKICNEAIVRLGKPKWIEKFLIKQNFPGSFQRLVINFILNENNRISEEKLKQQSYLDWLCLMEIERSIP